MGELNKSVSGSKIIDTLMLKSRLIQHKDFSEDLYAEIVNIYPIPNLIIKDNCFVAINCNYNDPNLFFCLENESNSKHKYFFIELLDKKFIFFYFDVTDDSSNYLSWDYYLFTQGFNISQFCNDHIKKNLFYVDHLICYYDKDLYTFDNIKPVLFYDYFHNDHIGHNPNYYDGCKYPFFKLDRR